MDRRDIENSRARVALLAEPGMLQIQEDPAVVECLERMQLEILRKVGPKRRGQNGVIDEKWENKAWKTIAPIMDENPQARKFYPEQLVRYRYSDDDWRGFDYLHPDDSNDGGRLVACVDDLGDAQRLLIVDECTMLLTTNRGVFRMDCRAFEPAYTCAFFISVEINKPNNEKLALYFDPRIIAALHKRKLLWAMRDRDIERKWSGREIELPTLEEAWSYIRTQMHSDSVNCVIVARGLVWVDAQGKPLDAEHDVGLFGVSMMPRLAQKDSEMWRFFSATVEDLSVDELHEEFLEARYSVLSKRLGR